MHTLTESTVRRMANQRGRILYIDQTGDRCSGSKDISSHSQQMDYTKIFLLFFFFNLFREYELRSNFRLSRGVESIYRVDDARANSIVIKRTRAVLTSGRAVSSFSSRPAREKYICMKQLQRILCSSRNSKTFPVGRRRDCCSYSFSGSCWRQLISVTQSRRSTH